MLDSLILLAAVFLTSFLTWKLCSHQSKLLQSQQKEMLEDLRSQLRDLQRDNKELLNRLQAGDINTFRTLQYNTQEKVDKAEYVQYPRSDEGEVAQMKAMYAENFDEEAYVAPSDQPFYDAMLSQFGLGD